MNCRLQGVEWNLCILLNTLISRVLKLDNCVLRHTYVYSESIVNPIILYCAYALQIILTTPNIHSFIHSFVQSIIRVLTPSKVSFPQSEI